MIGDIDAVHAELAAKYRVKLPRRNAGRTTANQARFLRQLGLTWGKLVEITGERRGTYFPLNPTRSCHDWAGECLEMLDYAGWAR